MNSKDIKPWQDRIDLADTTMVDKREAMFSEISELRQALEAAEARLAAIKEAGEPVATTVLSALSGGG